MREYEKAAARFVLINHEDRFYIDPKTLVCPKCGRKATLNKDLEKPRWVCKGYPICNSFVYCFEGTKLPKGTLAHQKIRDLRRKCYQKLENIIRSRDMERKAAFKRVGQVLGIQYPYSNINYLMTPHLEKLLRAFELREYHVLKRIAENYDKEKENMGEESDV